MIISKYKAENLSIQDLIQFEINSKSEIGKSISHFLETEREIPQDLIFEMFLKKFKTISKQNGWILSGFPKNEKEFEFLTENKIRIDHVILMKK